MRFDGIDFLRGIAAFCIVGCHVALLPMTDIGWRIHDLCDMNVGVFAALSGFLMWKEDGVGPWRAYARRRASRLLPIYFLWTGVFVLFGFVFDVAIRHALNEKWLDWDYYPKLIFGGQASAHLWYLVCLLYIQLLLGAGERFVKRIPWAGLLAVSLGIIWFASVKMNVWLMGYPVRMAGFVLAGYALRLRVAKISSTGALQSGLWLMLGLFLAVTHFRIGRGALPVFVKDWIVAVPVLLAFIHMPVSGKARKIGNVFGVTSLGVYLIHPLITAGAGLVMKKVFSAPYGAQPILVDMFVCWLLSFVVVLALVRNNLTRRWVS